MAHLIAAGGLSTDLHPGKVILGEGPGVDITLPAGLGLAKVHAELRPLLGGYVIKHLGGDAFQTLVNDKPVTSIANLTCGDSIRVGAVPFTLVLKEKPEKSQPAPTEKSPIESASGDPTAESALSEPEEKLATAKQTPIAEHTSAQDDEAPSIPFPRLSKPSLVQTPPAEVIPRTTPIASPPAEVPSAVDVSMDVGLAPMPPPEPSVADVTPDTGIPVPPIEQAPSPHQSPQDPSIAPGPAPNQHAEAFPPPQPTNLAEEETIPGHGALPPLPPNLAEAAPSPGNDPLPPLPPNLVEAAHSPGNDTLPPLPPNLVEAAPSPGNDTLPPLPPNLVEAAPSPGNGDELSEHPVIDPAYDSGISSPPPQEPMTWDDNQSFASDPAQNVTVKLAPPSRTVERARRKSPLVEFAMPGMITLFLIAGGIIFLQQHNKKLARQIESEVSPMQMGTTGSEPKTPKPGVANSGFTEALEKLSRERKRPRHYEFPAENFIFKAPGPDWLSTSSSQVPEAQVILEHTDGDCMFVIIGEALGEDSSYTEKDLREVVKRHMLTFTPHLQFVNKGKIDSKGMSFNRFDARARMDGSKRYIVNISTFHQGFFYQLITFGEGNGNHEAPIEAKALTMLRHFDLIDHDRVLSLKEDYAVNAFSSPQYGYSVNLNEHFWEPWRLREFEFPGAHMAAQSAQGSIFGVMPIQFPGEAPNLDDLTTALLGSLGIRYPAQDLQVEDVVLANGQGRQVIHQRVEGRQRLQYQVQVIKRGNVAYLAGGWSPAFNRVAIREIPKALKQLTFQEPNPASAPPKLSYGQRRAQSVIMHQLGVLKLYNQELDLALNYFKSAVDTHPAYYEVYTQLVNTFASVGRATEGVAFLLDLAQKRNDVKAKAALALMHCHAGQVDEGKRQYEALFAQDFHDQEHFHGFMNALASERRYDEALELIRTVGAKESSLLQALFEGLILNDKGDFTASLAILEPLHRDLDSDSMVSRELARALIGLKRDKEAFALADSAAMNDETALAEFIRGVCHDQLEAYEDAKACYTKAARLHPLNLQYQTALAATSSVMGQGDSSLVKVKVEAVPMPDTVKEAIKNLQPGSKASVHESYHITVADYRKGRPYKTTENQKVKATDPSAVRALSTLQYGFHPTADQIYVNYLLVRDSTGEIVAEGDVNETFITDVPATQIASDGKILQVPVPGLAPGHELEIAVTRQRQGTASNFGFHREILASPYPTSYRAYAITGDTSSLDYHATSNVALAKRKGVLVWSSQKVPPFVPEAYQAPLEAFVPVLEVSEPSQKSWKVLGDDYLHSLRDRLDLDDTTRTTARREVAAAKTPREKVEALARYVQKSITYKGIEFGQRALIPNKSGKIILNRYGDCKDHSLLLHQLYRAVGIPSHLVLIHSRLGLRERFPNLGQFNHMILAVQLDGRLHYIDCTNKYASVIENSADSMAGRRCLILEEGNSKLGTLPRDRADSRITINHAVTVNADGSLSCKDTATFSGSSGTRYRTTFAAMTAAQRETTLEKMLRMPGRFQMHAVDFGNLDNPSQPFTLTLSYEIADAFGTSEVGREGSLAWPIEIMLLSADDSSSERQSPIEVVRNEEIEGTVTLTLPPSITLAPMGQPAWSDQQGSDQKVFAYEISQNDGSFLTYRCVTAAGDYPASDYPEFQAAKESFLNALETKLALTRTALAADSERE